MPGQVGDDVKLPVDVNENARSNGVEHDFSVPQQRHGGGELFRHDKNPDAEQNRPQDSPGHDLPGAGASENDEVQGEESPQEIGTQSGNNAAGPGRGTHRFTLLANAKGPRDERGSLPRD